MDLTRFTALVESYGANPARWPEAERDAALVFAAADPAVCDPILDDARALDTQLEADLPTVVSSALQERLLAMAGSPAAVAVPYSSRLPDWAGMAAALALCAGLGLGWVGASLAPVEPVAQEALYMTAFESLGDDAAWTLEDAR